MKTSGRLRLATAMLVTGLVGGLLAGGAAAGGAAPAHLKPVAYRNTAGVRGEAAKGSGPAARALQLRSRALDERYHLVAASGTAGTAPALRALRLRGQALNERYHLGAATVVVSSGFDWGAFGIGAGSMLGIVLVGAGLAVVARVTRELDRPAETRG